MNVKIFKKESRNLLVCKRDDGTSEVADLGPQLPYHDLAHYVVETRLQLKFGFWGHIQKGASVAQLSDKEYIAKLPEQAIAAEIVTRALQSLWAGACEISGFYEIVQLEFEVYSIDFQLNLSEIDLRQMIAEYTDLIDRWRIISVGEAIELEWNP